MPQRAAAQSFYVEEGVAHVMDWPKEPIRDVSEYEILPFIDTLTVAYAYHAQADRPVLSLVLDWKPSGEAVYQGRRTSLSRIDGDIRMVAIELEADVMVAGLPASRFTLVVDSMMVGAYPDAVEIDLPHLTWENVFADASADEARHIFEKGFRLSNPKIISSAFAVFDDDGRVAESRRGRRIERPSRPRTVTVYPAHPAMIDIAFDLYWLLGRPARWIETPSGERRVAVGRGSGDSDRRSRAKGDRSARDEDRPDDASETDDGEETDRDRSGSRKGGGLKIPGFGDDDDDEDEDEDDRLVPYALAAVGAAGLLAVVGGTVGYYGNSRHAPYGLTSGIVRRDGGLLLQVAVNEALLFGETRPKRLLGKMLAFGDVFDSLIQPAVGAGFLATSRSGEDIEYAPSISLGAVARYKMMLFYGAYDVVQQGPEFGVALNFRELGLWNAGGEKSD